MVAGAMTLSQRIAAAVIGSDDSIEVIAQRLAQMATQQDILELIEEKARAIRRSSVRQVEASAFRERFMDRAAGAPITLPPSAELRQLFAERFSIGNGGTVTWGSATVAEHQERVSMLLKLRGGIDETIARHEEAIRMIEANGVESLEQIA